MYEGKFGEFGEFKGFDEEEGEKIDRNKRIGIIGAMEEEVEKLKADLSDVQVEERWGYQFVLGKLSGRDVVVVRSGIGKVSAGVCTQLLIDHYEVACIINTGIAGSLDSEIEIGDIVISEDAVQHDMDATDFGYPYGQIPRLGTFAFPASKRMRALALEENARVNPDIKSFSGRVCSGDMFVSDKESKEWIVRHFDGICCEMEGGAIAQVAWQCQVPFLILRAISDKADGFAKVDYPAFEKMAIEHCVKLTEALVARL